MLKRPAGSSGRFAEHADLPDLDDEAARQKKSRHSDHKLHAATKVSVDDSRKAGAAFERGQKRRDAERRKEEAARQKERPKREKLVAKAQSALVPRSGSTKNARMVSKPSGAISRKGSWPKTRAGKTRERSSEMRCAVPENSSARCDQISTVLDGLRSAHHMAGEPAAS